MKPCHIVGMPADDDDLKPTHELPTAPIGSTAAKSTTPGKIPPHALPKVTAASATSDDSATVDKSQQPTVALDPHATVPTHLAPTQGTLSTIALHIGVSIVPAARPIPEIIGGYRRLKPLGSGGMAHVFEGEHTTLGRKVALKLLKPNIADSADFNLRFLRESHAMAQVDHPNVVAIYDAGEADGIMYMALELVTGGDLHKLIKRRGHIAVDDALRWISGCAKGLEAIHAAGLVHRDIKPANIFLDRDSTPKIGDLGLARAADGEDRMTMTGSSWGTPSYMSPEQIKGVADLDIRADIYSLGATLYTLLIGVEPFVGETSYVITHKVMTEPPPDPRTHDKTIPAQVAAIVAKSMAKDRNNRYQTPKDMLEDLERARGGQRLLHSAAVPLASVAPKAISSQGEIAAAMIASTKQNSAKSVTRAQGIDPNVFKAIAFFVLVGILYLAWSSMQGMSFGEKTKESSEQPWAKIISIDSQGRYADLTIGSTAVRLRYCPPGTFFLGSSADEAGRQVWENRHQVTIAHGFWMLSTEVTQGLYQKVMNSNPSSTKGVTLPVEGISVEEAQAFCTKLAQHGITGARLPTEREWEYACRAGETGSFSAKPIPNEQGLMAPPELVQLWRATPEDDADAAAMRWVAQHVGDGDLGIKAVGRLAPNRFGLFDMHGNVLEWCSDHWDGHTPYAEGRIVESSNASELTIARGGCWFYPPERCRSASRLGLPATSTLNYVGFRFVVPDAGK